MHDKKHPYTLVSAELINNSSLTGEERFLLIYLLGRSDDYIFNSSYFANQAQKLFGWGRDKFYKVWMSLQNKGYISKEKIRINGMIDGEHYTVHEILPEFLKNQNTENPESGKPGIRQTSALPSIDKPSIDEPSTDEPTTTNTNHSGVTSSKGKTTPTRKRTYIKDTSVEDVFEYIRNVNPIEHSKNWVLNDKDRRLIKKAIDLIGIDKAKLLAKDRIGKSDKEYSTVSYIFSDFKSRSRLLTSVLKHPEWMDGIVGATFSESEVEKVLEEASEDYLYKYIQKAVGQFYKGALSWEPSDEDIEVCKLLVDYGEKINLAEKLQDGLKSAITRNDWSFHQIVYQARSALNTYDENYTL